ncbi:MAG TPA: ARMT1-like domain-containing protein [Chitinispirillaceae bacterium]|nr:ARMT1-like domain-containing protein [Chitinispirillaceae bacterium]
MNQMHVQFHFIITKIMKTFYDCLPCFVKQALGTLRRSEASDSQTESVMRQVFKQMESIDFSLPPPVTAKNIYRLIRNTVTGEDLYVKDKQRFNRFALDILPQLQKKVSSGPGRFEEKIKLAIAANIIDFGKNDQLCESDVLFCFNKALEQTVDSSAVKELEKSIDSADRILFLCDNAGEIVFDRYLLEDLPKHKIKCAVRGFPVINDATMEDAIDVGLADEFRVISNGADIPGTVLDECSEEFRKEFHDADFIIAKGQGNFETLSDIKDKKIFFLLQVKCPVIARDIGFPVGSFVIKQNVLEKVYDSKET